jgi:ribonucleoside-diphosphate reductase alpha chain
MEIKTVETLNGKHALKPIERENVLKAAIEYFKGDELAANVWINKYALKDSFGNIYEHTPDDMHLRIAREIHRIESKYPNPLSFEEIFEVLKDFKYIVPQGSPMAGIGNDFQFSSLSNCFVIGTGADSYGGALENLCMEVSIEAGQLSFDYKLKKGVSRSFNATLLMREMGIRV